MEETTKQMPVVPWDDQMGTSDPIQQHVMSCAGLAAALHCKVQKIGTIQRPYQSRAFNSVNVLNESTIVTGDTTGKLKFWDIETNKVVKQFKIPDAEYCFNPHRTHNGINGINLMRVPNTGSLLIHIPCDGRIWLCDPVTDVMELNDYLQTHQKYQMFAVPDENHLVISTARYNRVRNRRDSEGNLELLDISTNSSEKISDDLVVTSKQSCMLDDRHIAIGHSKEIKVYDVLEKKCVQTLSLSPGKHLCMINSSLLGILKRGHLDTYPVCNGRIIKKRCANISLPQCVRAIDANYTSGVPKIAYTIAGSLYYTRLPATFEEALQWIAEDKILEAQVKAEKERNDAKEAARNRLLSLRDYNKIWWFITLGDTGYNG